MEPDGPSLLDAYIPTWDARERFHVDVAAPPELVMATARAYDMQSHPLVRAIFEARSVVMGSQRITRVPRGLVDEMTSIGWGVLRDEPDRAFVAGATCRPWLADVRFVPIPEPEFRAFDSSGQVKIAWTIETTPRGEGTRLASETRAVATDANARKRFIPYWRWARFGIIPIRWFLLPAIARRAEAAHRARQRANAR